MREVTMPSRPCTVNGVHYPSGPLTAFYEPHEEAFMRELRERMGALPAGPERTALVEEARAIHEMKALLGGRIVPDGEQATLEFNEDTPSALDALRTMEGLEEKDPRWRLPDGVKKMMAGQTTLLDPAPPAGALRLPYSERDDLPDEEAPAV